MKRSGQQKMHAAMQFHEILEQEQNKAKAGYKS
jgi:hypothetical protein